MTADWSSPFDRLEALLPAKDFAMECAARLTIVAGREAAQKAEDQAVEIAGLKSQIRDLLAQKNPPTPTDP